MIRIFKLVILLVMSQLVYGQAPSNYTNINGRYRWIAGMFDSTFHIPKGSTPSLRTGGSTNAGALFYKTGDSSLYIYTGTNWLKIAGASGFVPYSGAIQDVNLGQYGLNGKFLALADTGGAALDVTQRTSSSSDVALNIKTSGVRGYAALIDQADSIAAGTQYNTIFRKSMMPGTGNPTNGGGVSWYTEIGNDNNKYRALSVYRARIIDSTGFANTNIKQTSTEFWTRKAGVWDTTLVLNGGNVGVNTGQNGIDSALTVANGIWLKRGVRMSALPTGVGTKALRIDANGNVSATDTTAVAGYVPYTGATQDVDLGNFSLNAKSFHIKGTAGQGHLGLKHQTATPSISANESGVYADVNGDLGLKNDNLYTSIFKTSLNSADRTYTFQNKSYTVGDSADIAARVRYTDTASMLSPYLRSNVAAATYVPLTRTITINGTSQDLSANRTYNVGTVTSVATNTGTGITGGTITTTGTIAADTLLLSTRAWRQKGIDSVASLINTRVSGTTNYIPKFTSSSAIGTGSLYDDGANIGLGTTTTTAISGGYTGFFMNGSSGSNVDFRAGGTGYGRVQADANGLLFAGLNSVPITFFTGGSERMRITSSGLVGIGTSAPSAKFEVANGFAFLSQAYAWSIYNTTGSAWAARIGAAGDVNLNTTGNNAVIAANGANDILFGTNSSERLRISSTGNVSIGNTNNTYKLDVSGDINVGGSSAELVRLSSTATNGSYLSFRNSGTLNGAIGTGSNLIGSITNSDLGLWTTGSMVFQTNGSVRMRLDASGNLGLGVTPSAWLSNFRVLQIGNSNSNTFLYGRSDNTIESAWGINAYYSSSTFDWRYSNNGFASNLLQISGEYRFYTAPSGTAGNAISFTQAMTLDALGRLGIGSTSPNSKLTLDGTNGTTASQIQLVGTGVLSGYIGPSADGLNFGTDAGGLLFRTGVTGNASVTTGSERMRITSGGNVGIGTSSPEQLLDLYTSGADPSTNLQIRANRTGYGNVRFNLITYAGGSSSTDRFTIQNNAGTNVLNVLGSGNVGIGTTSPGRPLEVYSATSDTRIAITNTTSTSGAAKGFELLLAGSDAYAYNYVNGNMIFGTNAFERMRLTSSGELLINTTSDAGDYKLQVNGNVYAAGNLDLRAASGTTWVDLLSAGIGSKNYRVTSQLIGVSNTGFGIRNVTDARNELEIDGSGNSTFYGSIKTAAPSGGTAKPYKWGEAGVAIGGSNGYAVKVEIDGTLYYLMTGYLPEPEPEPTAGPSMGYTQRFEQPTIKIKTESQEIKDLKKELEELKQLIKNNKK